MQDSPRGQDQPADPLDSSDEHVAGGRRGFSPFTFLFGFGAGAFVGVALALLAVAMADDANTPVTTASPIIQPDEQASAGTTVAPTPDARPKTKAATDVRLGPGNGFAIFGLLAKGESVEVVGKDNDSQWLAIRFPPGSTGRGWIPVGGVESPPALAGLAVVLATPLPRTISTFPPGLADAVGPGAALVVTRTADPNATPTVRPGPPDLVVTGVRLLPDRRVAVTVANRGPGDMVGFTVFVQVRDLASRSETISSVIPVFRVGSTLTLETSSFLISGVEIIQAIVDPFQSVPEADRTNNQVQVELAVPVTPTATPTPQGETP